MKKVLFVATVVKNHFMEFHIPYLKMFKEAGWETAVAARNDYENPSDCQIPYCDTYCSDIRGNTDLVENGVSGIISESTPEKLAEHIRQICNNPDSLKEISMKAYENVKKIDLSQVKLEINKIYMRGWREDRIRFFCFINYWWCADYGI